MIIGSRALKHYYPDFKRIPKDIDIIAQEPRSSKEVEHHWTPAFQYILDNSNKSIAFIKPDFLYTLKVSHAAWDVHWDKTMMDIEFMASKGCKLDPKLYQLLLRDWEVKHGPKRVKIKGSPKDFFNSNITRKIEHEEVHNLVKFYDRPMHEKIRINKNDVACSFGLWSALSHTNQLFCALEEIYVFALERYSDYPPRTAFNKAAKHLITISTKGWFNLFLIEHFHELRAIDKTNYIGYYERYKELIK